MKAIKKLFVLLFAFVIAFACFGYLKANADVATSDKIQVLGAGIRTTGNAGMRFKATVKDLEVPAGRSISKYGMLFAYGEDNDFVKGEEVNGYEVLSCEVDGLDEVEEEAYYVTIYGVPEDEYFTDVTTRAYVVLDDESIIYGSNTLARNIYEVAVAAKNDTDNYPEGGIPFIENLVKTSTLEFNGGALIPQKSFTIGAFNGGTGGTSGIIMGNSGSVTTAIYWQKVGLKAIEGHPGFYTVTGTAVSGSQLTDKTFDYVIAGYASSDQTLLKNAFADTNHYVYVDKLAKGATVKVYSKDEYVINRSLELADGFTLPTIQKDYYDFGGWYDNPLFEGDAITTHSGSLAKKYYAKFTPTNYTISYELNDGTFNGTFVTNYNYESAEIVLPTEGLTREGGEFISWCSDSGLTEIITSIPTGSHGNKTIYAKWYMPPTYLDLTTDAYKANANALSTLTPDIIVDPSFNRLDYYITNSGNTNLDDRAYRVGVDAFGDINAAINNATAGDIIYVFAGTYSYSVTVSKAVVLCGANYNINGNATRVAESNITGLIDVTANGVTLNGFLCTGSAAIKVSANQTTISYMKLDQVTPINCSSQNRKGAIADASSTTDLTVTNCYIKAKTPSSTSYEHQAQFMSLNNVTNLTFTNNYVTNVKNYANSDFAGMRVYTASGVINMSNNEINWPTPGYVFLFADCSKVTKIDFIENKITGNATQKACTIGFSKAPAGCKINIIGNEFIYFGQSTIYLSSDKGSTVTVKYNYFDANSQVRSGTIGSAKFVCDYNCYAGGIASTDKTGAANEVHKMASKEEVDAAYAIYKGEN